MIAKVRSRSHGGVVPVRLPTAGHRVDELLGKLDDRSVQRKIGRAQGYLPPNGVDDGRMRVAEDHRAAAEEVVDVLLAVGIPQP